MENTVKQHDIRKALVGLNYRLASRALNAWKGNISTASEYGMYEGFLEILTPQTILNLRDSGLESREKRRIVHSLLGHYLQFRALPYENELTMWMRGAAAAVGGEKVYLKDLHGWCQKQSTLETRRVLEKETSTLSKFLKPFALGSWEFVLGLLEEEFGYRDYVAYCAEKKGLDYESYVSVGEALLKQTDALYFEAMDRWSRKSLGVPLLELNRFDSIYLVGLGEFDGLFPKAPPLTEHLRFFETWGIDTRSLPCLHMDIAFSSKKGSQAMSFALKIPDEIYLVMNQQGGWIDFETLFHEMGHVLSSCFTSPQLPVAEKDLYSSNALSETYAFLVQNMCFTPAFLDRILGLGSREIETITHYKALKDLAFFRRYVAKFLAEYRMFKAKAVAGGELYAALLKEHTGFSYKPETHLFDLAPEFYALDYVISWIAEASMAKALVRALGEEWMFSRNAGNILKEWWHSGNKYELNEFFEVEGLGPIDPADILERWRTRIRTDGSL